MVAGGRSQGSKVLAASTVELVAKKQEHLTFGPTRFCSNPATQENVAQYSAHARLEELCTDVSKLAFSVVYELVHRKPSFAKAQQELVILTNVPACVSTLVGGGGGGGLGGSGDVGGGSGGKGGAAGGLGTP